jgi:hypothetical protein
MDVEDGVIWVYGVGEDGVMAFTAYAGWILIEFGNGSIVVVVVNSADRVVGGLREIRCSNTRNLDWRLCTVSRA